LTPRSATCDAWFELSADGEGDAACVLRVAYLPLSGDVSNRRYSYVPSNTAPSTVWRDYPQSNMD